MSQTTWARHPHVFFRPEQWASIKAKTRHPRFRRDWDQILEEATACLGAPILNDTDTVPTSLEIGAQKAKRCAFAHAITGKKAFADRAIEFINALPARKEWNRHPQDCRFGLTAGNFCRFLALTYDLVADRMTPVDRKRFVAACQREVVDVFLGECKNPVNHALCGTRTWNFVGVMAAGAACLMIALDGDGADLSREIEIARAHLLRFVEWYDGAGASPELDGYWAYGMGSALWGLVALRENGWSKIFRQRSCKLQRSAYPLLCMSVGAKFVTNFTDSVYGPEPGHPTRENRERAAALVLAAEFQDRHVQWYADHVAPGGEFSELGIITGDARLKASPPTGLPTCVAYHGAGVGVIRSSMTDPDALVLGLKAGRARGTLYDDPHSQFDLNAVTLEAFGMPLLADPGYGHRWDGSMGSHLDPAHPTNSTPPHNTVLVDGKGQLHEYSPFAHLQDLSPSTDVDYIVSRVEKGYGPKVRRFDRHAYMIDKSFYVIVDEIELARPGKVTWNFHAAKEATLDAGCVGRIRNGDVELVIWPFGDIPMRCRWMDDHVLPRLQWDTIRQVKQMRAGWLLFIRGSGGRVPEASAVLTGDRVQVTRGRKEWLLPVVVRRAGWRSDVMLPFGGKVKPDVAFQ